MSDMTRGIDLDIDPTKFESYTDKGINGLKENESFKPYTRYEYSRITKTLQLNSVLYSGTKLENFKGITKIERFYTYFNDNKVLLAFEFYTNDKKYYYYTTGNSTKSTKADATFDIFVTKNDPASGRHKESGKKLTNEQVKTILRNIEANTTLEYDDLDVAIKENLWRIYDVVFDLSKTTKGEKYKSEVTNVNVTVTDGGKIDKKYPMFKHTSTVPFYIRGIKNTDGGNIDVPGGFPNEPLDGSMNVYYGESDGKYTDPLFVILSPKENDGDPIYIKSQYILSKNNENSIATWDIRRVEGSIGDSDLKEILPSIYSGKKLDITKVNDEGLKKKLIDITEDLTIDCTKDFQKEKGKYDSDGREIPYKKTNYAGYTAVSHAYGFTTFTITKIQVTTNESISPSNLLPKRTDRLSRLVVFYNGDSKDSEPLLIYLLHSDGEKIWLSRDSGDKEWKKPESEDTTPSTDVDTKNIKKLLEKLSNPKVIIDILNNSGLYTPTGTSVSFNIKENKVKGSDYWEFKYTRNPNGSFIVKQVKHNQTILNGISSPNIPLIGITAYYEGQDPKNKENLLMVCLEKKNGGRDEYVYYSRAENGTNWTVILDKTSKLGDSELIQRLKDLKEKQRPKKPESSPPEKGDPGVIPSDYGKTDGTSRQDSSGNHSSSPESTVASPQSSSNAGAIAGGLIGGIVCIVLLALLIKKVGPSVRAHLESRNPPL